MKTFKNKIVASALALSLVGGAIIATPKTAEADSKPLLIKKVLNLPEKGVTTPITGFRFKFTGHSKNGDEGKKDDVPTIPDEVISYTDNDKDDNDTSKDGKQLIKESTNDVLANVGWPEAGQYTYTVTEEEGTTPGMVYSKASYLVSIFVRKNDKGTLEVESIQISKLKTDDGNNIDLNKTEYEPGEGTDPTKKKNNFVFENYYNKKDGNDNPGGGTKITDEDKKGFALRKTIKGEHPDENAEFEFSFYVIKPQGSGVGNASYDYYKVDSKGQVGEKQTANYANNNTSQETDDTFVKQNVKLKHNERIVFGKVLLGSTVTVDETKAGAYVGSVSSSFNGSGVTSKSGVIGDQAGGNWVEYENTKQTATGLLIENLPFLALILVAGVGIIFFVNNKKEEEPA